MVFDNGDKRKQAAIDFVKWLTAPEQVKTFSLATGDLPTRTSVGQDQAFVDKLNEKLPGTGVFVQNLANVKKVRPTRRAVPGRSPRRWARRSCPSCSARRSRQTR